MRHVLCVRRQNVSGHDKSAFSRKGVRRRAQVISAEDSLSCHVGNGQEGRSSWARLAIANGYILSSAQENCRRSGFSERLPPFEIIDVQRTKVLAFNSIREVLGRFWFHARVTFRIFKSPTYRQYKPGMSCLKTAFAMLVAVQRKSKLPPARSAGSFRGERTLREIPFR